MKKLLTSLAVLTTSGLVATPIITIVDGLKLNQKKCNK